MLRLLRDMPTMACILAPMLERLFFSSVPTVPTAVSDWLPSVFSRLHMSPLILVLLVMFIPPDEPICLCFILDAKSLSANPPLRKEGGQGIDRGQRRGERPVESIGKKEGVKDLGQEQENQEVRGGEGQKGRIQVKLFMTYSIVDFEEEMSDCMGYEHACVVIIKCPLLHMGLKYLCCLF